jgi:predicted lipid-binding transport protein (Tim44 family)
MFAERPGRPYVGRLTFGGRVTTLIILAMVFVFVALRLWSVLGRRTGHEQPIAKPDAVLTPRSTSVTVPQTDAQTLIAQESTMATTAVNGLRAIASAEPQFDAARFLDGAKQAYGMILEAFWRGDNETLRSLVDPEVAGAFEQAIADREEAGERLDNRLVSIEQAQIEDASVEGNTAHIRVRFEADVSAVTRDRDGNVVAGSMSDAVPTNDVWTFSRVLKSPDPNWVLTETDEAA